MTTPKEQPEETKKKMGRPRVEVHKPFKHLSIHCSPEEVEMIKEKAAKAGKPVGRYLIELAKEN